MSNPKTDALIFAVESGVTFSDLIHTILTHETFDLTFRIICIVTGEGCGPCKRLKEWVEKIGSEQFSPKHAYLYLDQTEATALIQSRLEYFHTTTIPKIIVLQRSQTDPKKWDRVASWIGGNTARLSKYCSSIPEQKVVL